jgi:hypothetical protein
MASDEWTPCGWSIRDVFNRPWKPLSPPPPDFRLPPGSGFRIHVPGYAGARGYVNDDGLLVIVGAEREEDDGPR